MENYIKLYIAFSYFFIVGGTIGNFITNKREGVFSQYDKQDFIIDLFVIIISPISLPLILGIKTYNR
jgi:hypothetical protein